MRFQESIASLEQNEEAPDRAAALFDQVQVKKQVVVVYSFVGFLPHLYLPCCRIC